VFSIVFILMYSQTPIRSKIDTSNETLILQTFVQYQTEGMARIQARKKSENLPVLAEIIKKYGIQETVKKLPVKEPEEKEDIGTHSVTHPDAPVRKYPDALFE
jgi:hypothetical protein